MIINKEKDSGVTWVEFGLSRDIGYRFYVKGDLSGLVDGGMREGIMGVFGILG